MGAKPFTYHIFVTALMLLIIPSQNAYAQDRGSRSGAVSNLCLEDEPRVVVKLATSKTKYYKNYDARTINSIHSAPGGGTILGLAGGPLEIATRGQFSIRADNKGKACVKIKNLEVLFWAKPVVVIASNFPKGSCEYKQVFAHEQQHIRITRRFIKEYAPKLRKQVNKIIDTSRQQILTRQDNIEEAQMELQDPILARIDQYFNSIMPILQSRQAAIDTPEEYAKVNARCDNWGARLNQ